MPTISWKADAGYSMRRAWPARIESMLPPSGAGIAKVPRLVLSPLLPAGGSAVLLSLGPPSRARNPEEAAEGQP
jgi:hypothetical protein